MTAPRIVAGFDGSQCSEHAADWAAGEAEQRGAELLLVHAAEEPGPSLTTITSSGPAPSSLPGSVTGSLSGSPSASRSGSAPAPVPAGPAARSTAVSAEPVSARTLLAAAVTRLRELHPSVPITTVLAGPPAATSLQHSAAGALLTVVGSWGTGRSRGVPLGSVAFSVASTSRTPVAVVRPQHGPPTRRPVAVAMDGPSAPQGALDFAFDTADCRNVRLLALHVRHDAAIDGAFPYQVVRGPVLPTGLVPVRDPADTEEGGAALLLQLAPWQRRYPRVHVTPVILFGSPAATLLDFSHRTDLLVIGDAGRGVNSGMFLGSTGQALLHGSACPVVVARSRRSDR